MAKRETINLYLGLHVRKDWARRGMSNVAPEFSVQAGNACIVVSREACGRIADDCAEQVLRQAANLSSASIADYKDLYMDCQKEMIAFDNQDKLVPPWPVDTAVHKNGDGPVLIMLNLAVYEDWGRRNMGDVVPEFNSVTLANRVIRVSREACKRIATDCVDQMTNPSAEILHTAKLYGYPGLLNQCQEALNMLDSASTSELPESPSPKKTTGTLASS